MKKAIAFSMAVFICAGLCIPGTAAAPTYPDAPVYGDEKAQKTLIEENPLETDFSSKLEKKTPVFGPTFS